MAALAVTFQVLTVITSVCMRIAPFPDFWRVYKAKRTGEVQTLPVVLLFTNCAVLVWYGYFSGNILPLVVTSVLGLFTSVGFIAIFYRYTDNRRSVHKTCAPAIVFIALVCLYGTIGVKGITGQSKASMATTMGAISFATSIGQYGSPLATIRRIVRTKSTASMPFTLCVVSFCNSACWMTYSILLGDVWLLLRSASGFSLTLIQLTLYAIYPSVRWTTARTRNDASATDCLDESLECGTTLSQSVTSSRCDQKGVDLDRTGADGDSIEFVELRTPSAR
ncbi:unnamed protein product [Hyaloperonospora brassicae]|uniref:Sugar transporter SWEET1 n=1 Tax=Hyaloperonospora brassicae TaxID=162125 RepID=A0AAV0T6F5_HYABA|nr:unnamed protein product [Hyaloperonospora brassicae]